MVRQGQGDEWSAVRSEFAAWYATPAPLRRQFGMPRTQEEFADLKGVTTRTLRRWRERDDFREEVELHRRRIEAGVDGGTVAVKVNRPKLRPGSTLEPAESRTDQSPVVADTDEFEVGISKHELLYRQAKDDVFARAAEGSAPAIELMMKYWGREMLAQEQAEQQLFAEMSDGELVDEVVSLLGEERLLEVLAVRAAR